MVMVSSWAAACGGIQYRPRKTKKVSKITVGIKLRSLGIIADVSLVIVNDCADPANNSWNFTGIIEPLPRVLF
jgi:hypothetical protein